MRTFEYFGSTVDTDNQEPLDGKQHFQKRKKSEIVLLHRIISKCSVFTENMYVQVYKYTKDLHKLYH